ncbi:hypothetical protein F4778DRAFT_726702 [Xylariomycetidae sp. FL2044]|nr:hypothetical protein F4778DRAFT_726702 [Xylariomycetidae sp. FL2044]
MDAAKNFLGGSSSSNTTANTQQGGQKDDFVDKLAAKGNTQYAGGKFSHDQLEKITDKARETFESSTGKNVPDKVSN